MRLAFGVFLVYGGLAAILLTFIVTAACGHEWHADNPYLPLFVMVHGFFCGVSMVYFGDRLLAGVKE